MRRGRTNDRTSPAPDAAAAGSLEINPFLPLIAHSLLESCGLPARACRVLRRHCIDGIEADEARCRRQVENSTAAATALVPVLGYGGASRLLAYAKERGPSVKDAAVPGAFVTPEQLDEWTGPEAVCRLGSPGRNAR